MAKSFFCGGSTLAALFNNADLAEQVDRGLKIAGPNGKAPLQTTLVATSLAECMVIMGMLSRLDDEMGSPYGLHSSPAP